ncbi:MAG: hypothetical protein ABJB05_06790 [Parafilimonas sp.]
MTQQIFDDYLKALYLKSKNDLRSGYSEKLIAKLIGLSRTDAQNVLHYLAAKYIDTKNGFGNNISLTNEGIDYVLKLHKAKKLKTIKFKKADYLPPASRLVFGFLYWYDLVNEDGTVQFKTIAAFASDVLTMIWGLTWDGKGPLDAEKILLQFAKDKIIEKVKEETLNDQEELTLMTSTQPAKCPYNAENLIETKYAEFEIEFEVETKSLTEEIMDGKLAISIIETRDEINAVFREKFGDNLLLLNQERNIVDFFKTATSFEEFAVRTSSLAEISRNLNVSFLRKTTNDKSEPAKLSVELLEMFANQKMLSTEIIEVLRNFGRIRQGYPNHMDNPRVIKSLQYFNISYPVRDFEGSWTTLLTYYLNALKTFFNDLLGIS